ncbi:ISL3 family transposase [Lentibacillus cibarius]|uniref:ISL3 family transposase n=1 Tax=Lentibacillus cibarius TaxID=2583219 RepID=A0A5S3QLH5_9BACI|nr:ISL3 family transposase [Lentibacillus cibarius]TMN22629.1 ISL3 family transposase [Lentibacillus cibarius]TMN23539.1 ISL3 family transposase [Lentibacillus cibarius]
MLIEIKDLENVFHIPEPWYIDNCIFDENKEQLDVYVKVNKSAPMICSNCDAERQRFFDIADYDQRWRHLNFLEYPCYIHAEHPRTDCKKCGKKHRVDIPWAIKTRAGFTKLFDAWIMMLVKDMPMSAVSRLVKEHDTRLWRILHHYVDNALATQDLSHVTKINTDETSSKRGHNYITIFVDSEKRNVIHVTKGKDASTWEKCKERLEAQGGNPDNVTEVCMDMSPAFIKGASEYFPDAAITFDKFHVIQEANKAVDAVRRTERKTCAELKNTRYVWLKNEKNLTKKQKGMLDKLKDSELDTAKAYRMRLVLQEIYQYPAQIAPMVLEDWIQWGLRCRLEPMVELAKTLRRHYDGVVQWFQSQLNNGIMEGINSLFQAAKRKARGYRSDKNIVAIVYLLAGKLDFTPK